MAEESTAPGPRDPQISPEGFTHLIWDLDKFYLLTNRLSQAIRTLPTEFLIQEMLAAFSKTSMSLLGFLRFMPPSKFYAKEGYIVVDLSSASVMARQVLEDALSFFYLAEAGLTPEEKEFRKLVWELHGLKEGLDSAVLGYGSSDIPNLDVLSTQAELKRRREVIAKHPMLGTIKDGGLHRRIKDGTKNRILPDSEILQRREIAVDRYKFPYKVFSNFTHFSMLCRALIKESHAGWVQSYQRLFFPAVDVGYFVGEIIGVFQETFPQTQQLLSEIERNAIANCRESLRS